MVSSTWCVPRLSAAPKSPSGSAMPATKSGSAPSRPPISITYRGEPRSSAASTLLSMLKRHTLPLLKPTVRCARECAEGAAMRSGG